jgi:hypothetical protein
MSRLHHHLLLLGWRWLALFVIWDVVAIVSAILAAKTQTRTCSTWCLRTSVAATLASAATTIVSFVSGLGSTRQIVPNEVIASPETAWPVGGGPLAFNNAIFAIALTMLAVTASFVCLGIVVAGSKTSK